MKKKLLVVVAAVAAVVQKKIIIPAHLIVEKWRMYHQVAHEDLKMDQKMNQRMNQKGELRQMMMMLNRSNYRLVQYQPKRNQKQHQDQLIMMIRMIRLLRNQESFLDLHPKLKDLVRNQRKKMTK